MPSYMWLYSAEIAPRKKPSTSAYSGAVTGAHVFLNTVTMARMKPPIRPPHMYTEKPGAISPPGVNAWLHANAAVRTVSNSRNAVLLTVPLMVIVPAPSRVTTVPLPRSRKVESERTGLPLRMDSPRGSVCVCLRGRIHGRAGRPPARGAATGVVRKGGLEPPRLAALVPKTRASTNSATFASCCRPLRRSAPQTKNARRGRALRVLVGRQGFEPWTY